MKNIPRIFIGDDVAAGAHIPAPRDVAHYLTHVMRRRDCLVFGGGAEFTATLSDDGRSLVVGDKTSHNDPSGNLTLMFAPIKCSDELIDMATQMGVAVFQPVITEYTTATHINWDRMHKIAISAAQQSNRNSVPKILPPIKFADADLSDIAFADERAAHGAARAATAHGVRAVFVGPEGGFSDTEFAAFDAAGAIGISLGATILRAQTAAVVAISRVVE